MRIVSSFIKLLTFTIKKDEISNFGKGQLILGLFITWLVGMGRYWDHPKAHLLQHLGVGSIIYVFVLSAFLYLLLKPLAISKLQYFNLLTFVTMTALPGLFYAVPIEKMVSMERAVSINIYFLGIVALWRMALLFFYLRRYLELTIFRTIIMSLLPLVFIVSTLSFLNLEHAVFEIMGGIEEGTSKDGSYAVVLLLTLLSWIFLIPLLISYGVMIYKRTREKSYE